MNVMIEMNDEKPAIEELCRLCANTDKQFIPIFQGEGIEHNVAERIKKYLPIITVTKVDELPLQICYQCTSTLLAWHNFFEQCRVADCRLREMSANVKFNEDDGSYLDYTDDFHDDFEDEAIVSERISVDTQEETLLPEFIVGDTGDSLVMETSDNDIVNVNKDVSESVAENFDDNRFARKMTSERGTKDDVRLAPKETPPRESGEEYGGMLSGGDALSFCECLKGTDKAGCSTCAKNEGRSVRCQHCPMVFLGINHLTRHMSSSHDESSLISSSPRESANMPGRPSKRRMSEKSAPLESGSKVKVHKVEAAGKPPGDVEAEVNDCATSPRLSSFQCPECPKVYQSARSLKRHSAIHQRMTLFNAENENSGQNRQLAADSISKNEKFDVDPSANKATETIGEPESNSDEPSPSRVSTTIATIDAAAVSSSLANLESSSAERPATESKTEKTACRSSRRSAAKNDGEPPQPSLPMDTIVCSVCQETFDDEATFAEHQQLKHGGAYPTACDICELQFPTPTLLRAHKIVNHRSRRGRLAAEKDPFSRWYVYANGQKHLKCDQCNYNSLWYHKGRFLEHYRIHTGERPFTCDLCGKQFRTRTLMQKHVTFVHEGVKEHACDLCGRHFSDKRYMEDHRRIHTGERPYVCDLCGKTFKQSASLFIHKELHKGLRKHACDMCGKRFTTRSSLNIHIKRHVGERNFVCAVCGKAFVDGKHLRDHSTVHSDERPFGCELCGARFKLMKHLKQHGRTHKRNFPGSKSVWQCTAAKTSARSKTNQLILHPLERNLPSKCRVLLSSPKTRPINLDPIESTPSSRLAVQTVRRDNHPPSLCKNQQQLRSGLPTNVKQSPPLPRSELHSSRGHVCEMCGKCLSAKCNPGVRTSSCPPKPATTLQCNVCMREFAFLHLLRRHQQKCTGDAGGETDPLLDTPAAGRKDGATKIAKKNIRSKLVHCKIADPADSVEWDCVADASERDHSKAPDDDANGDRPQATWVSISLPAVMCNAAAEVQSPKQMIGDSDPAVASGHDYAVRSEVVIEEEEPFSDGAPFGDSDAAATFGNNPAAATFGNNPAAATFGNNPAAATFGNNPAAATFGNNPAAATGNNPAVASSHDLATRSKGVVEDEKPLGHVAPLKSSSQSKRKIPEQFEKMMVMIDGRRCFQCDRCSYLCVMASRLRLHYRRHTNERPFTCEVCGRQFRLLNTLRNHIKSVHEGVRKFGCEVCGRYFAEKRYLKTHRNLHAGKRQFVCDICGARFGHLPSLQAHQRTHASEPSFRCQVCPNTYTHLGSFRLHMKRHRGELNYRCDICSKAFIDRQHLSRHKAIHSEERPFACDVCGASFKLAKYMQSHKKTHGKVTAAAQQESLTDTDCAELADEDYSSSE